MKRGRKQQCSFYLAFDLDFGGATYLSAAQSWDQGFRNPLLTFTRSKPAPGLPANQASFTERLLFPFGFGGRNRFGFSNTLTSTDPTRNFVGRLDGDFELCCVGAGLARSPGSWSGVEALRKDSSARISSGRSSGSSLSSGAAGPWCRCVVEVRGLPCGCFDCCFSLASNSLRLCFAVERCLCVHESPCSYVRIKSVRTSQPLWRPQ